MARDCVIALETSGASHAAGWSARLDLRFSLRAGRTILSARRHHGPLRVQRPFYPEPNGACHVYLLHPPGGVVGGDRLETRVQVDPGAHALVTTPAANKLYRSVGPLADLRQELSIAPGAALEWLPQETIVFDGARAQSLSRVDLAAGGRFIGWEVLCLGRPAAQERFAHGALRACFELWRGPRPLWLERGRYLGGARMLGAPWGLAGFPVQGTLVCTLQDVTVLSRAREACAAQCADELCSITQLEEVLVCRYLGHHGERARRALGRAWSVLRPAVLGKEACPPRIWKT